MIRTKRLIGRPILEGLRTKAQGIEGGGPAFMALMPLNRINDFYVAIDRT